MENIRIFRDAPHPQPPPAPPTARLSAVKSVSGLGSLLPLRYKSREQLPSVDRTKILVMVSTCLISCETRVYCTLHSCTCTPLLHVYIVHSTVERVNSTLDFHFCTYYRHSFLCSVLVFAKFSESFNSNNMWVSGSLCKDLTRMPILSPTNRKGLSRKCAF